MALDNFQIDWSKDTPQTFEASFVDGEAEPSSPLKHFFGWTEYHGRSSVKPSRTGHKINKSFYTGLDLPDEHKWRFE
jgi:hypothetical protein